MASWQQSSTYMSKAYDWVEWSLLWAILDRMGFFRKWIKLIQTCVMTVEGKELGTVLPQQSLRQGDPLSPYLFIIVLEGLSAMI